MSTKRLTITLILIVITLVVLAALNLEWLIKAIILGFIIGLLINIWSSRRGRSNS